MSSGAKLMDIDYDIINIKKFNWYDTQAYKFNKHDNNGYIYGYVEWYGNQDLDDALEYSDDDVSWSWFKTEQERDKSFFIFSRN
tara:strand:- start:50 stop:301 length:252 start_codon:yes stop_codon:yes gene_type:complete